MQSYLVQYVDVSIIGIKTLELTQAQSNDPAINITHNSVLGASIITMQSIIEYKKKGVCVTPVA